MSTDGLRFYNLSHRVGHNMVQWPSPFSKPFVANRLYYHSMHDFYAVEYDGIMHRGTHMDTPAHVEPDQPYLDGFDVWRFFGTGVAVSIPKQKWGVITPEDLAKAEPEIRPGDIVMINTGAHHLFGDNDDYFAYSPGLYTEAAQWLVDRRVKLVGIDVQALDHPLATEWGPRGINVNAIAPTVFRSALTEWIFADTEAGRASRERNYARISLKRLGEPEDFVGIVLYLLSAASDFVTGQVIYVDGGYTAA